MNGQSAGLAKRSWQPGKRTRSVNSLLVACGMPQEVVYLSTKYTVDRYQNPQPRSLWDRYDGRLEELAFEAKRAFRASVHALRPDLDGNEQAARDLLVAWGKLRKLFARRGIQV